MVDIGTVGTLNSERPKSIFAKSTFPQGNLLAKSKENSPSKSLDYSSYIGRQLLRTICTTIIWLGSILRSVRTNTEFYYSAE